MLRLHDYPQLLVVDAKMGDVVSKCNGIEVAFLTPVGL